MTQDIRISGIPTSFQVTAKKRFVFNLNHYRNAHYQVLNKAKRYMADWVKLLQIRQRFTRPVEIEYHVTCRGNADFMNYVAVVDKFFQDALVSAGVLVDDSIDYVRGVVVRCEKGALRVDAVVREIK